MTRLQWLASIALVTALPAAAQAKPARMTAFDVLSQPNRTITLKAKLERKMLGGMVNPDVEKETLDFFLVEKNGRKLAKPLYLGNGETDSDGIAKLDWKPKDPGQYEVKVRIRKGSEYSASPALIRIAIPSASRSIVLVQLDGTVSQATNIKMFRGTENDKIKSVEGCKELLRLLSQHHQLVYLTDLDVSFTSKFKSWLDLRGIPRAPVIFWELFERSLSHETYMRKLVAKLKADHPQVAIGIGGTPEDGKAFAENGLTAIVIKTPDKDDDLPDTVITAENWKYAFAHVLRCRQTESLLRVIAAGKDAAAVAKARRTLSLLDASGIAYVARFRYETDPNLASAAQMLLGQLRACRTFAASLDLTTAERARNALLAAWRYGEPSVLRGLYQRPADAKTAKIPSFLRVEEVGRAEPEPRKVVYKLRLIQAGGKSTEVSIAFFQQDDKRWKVVTE